MNFKRVMAAMIVSCSLVSVVSPLEMGVNDINETAEAAQEETELNIEVEPVNAPIVSAEPEIEWKTKYFQVFQCKFSLFSFQSNDGIGLSKFTHPNKYIFYDIYCFRVISEKSIAYWKRTNFYFSTYQVSIFP